jgi:[acyl-carrier-protein] S-malonyltransferase
MNRLALLFSGQGSQYSGMGRAEYDRLPEVRALFEEASDLLGHDIQALCFKDADGKLDRTEYAQTALYTVSMAMFRTFQAETGLQPDYAAGHSLGEYAALTCAGALNFRDGLYLVHNRAKLMQEAADSSKGIMYVIRGPKRAVVERICLTAAAKHNDVGVSNYNSSEQHVISGSREGVLEAAALLDKQGATVIPLAIQAPFHCNLMDEASLKFADILDHITFAPPRFPVLSSVNARPYPSDPALMKPLLAQQMKMPVRWSAVMAYLSDASVEMVVEIGPRAILRNLAQENDCSVFAYAYDKEEDRAWLRQGASYREGGNLDLIRDYTRFIQNCVSAAVTTRNRNWSEAEYECGVIHPYQEVKELFYRMKDSGREATREEALKAQEMLKSVLLTKQVSTEEQRRIWQDIFHFNV